MKRWHQEAARSARERRKRIEAWGQMWFETTRKTPGIGRWRKSHALSCNKTRCGLCKWYKYPKRELTRQEDRFHRFADEQVRDLL